MAGLDDVIAAETVLSDVDGANGRLIIRGMPVEELARSETAESVAALLLDGFFDDCPNGQELAAAHRQGAARDLSTAASRIWRRSQRCRRSKPCAPAWR